MLNFGQDSAMCIKSGCLASAAFPHRGRLDSYGTRPSYSKEFLFTEAGSGDYAHDSDDNDDDGGDKYHHHNTCRLL